MKTDNLTVVIIGASGLVGRTLISILNQRKFPVADLRLCSSPGGQGREMEIDGEKHFAKPFEQSAFKNADIVFFSGPDDLSVEYAPMAISEGAVVIDNSAHFRMKPDVPLVIPEVNAHALKSHKGLIANPNCTTSGLVCALAPINKALGLEWVAVSSYQAISGAGLKAKENFIEKTRTALENNLANLNPKELAFNLIPAVGSFSGDQNYSEEDRLIGETRKILHEPTLKVYPTCVRVPVVNVHSLSAYFQTKSKFSEGQIELILQDAPGVEIVDDPKNGEFPTPVAADGRDEVFVGRIRRFEENLGSFWVVTDNLRKGAALNSVQIAEHLIEIKRAK